MPTNVSPKNCTRGKQREFWGQQSEASLHAKIEAAKRGGGGKTSSGHTLSVTEITVWATEKPVAQTVIAQALALRSVEEGFLGSASQNLCGH